MNPGIAPDSLKNEGESRKLVSSGLAGSKRLFFSKKKRLEYPAAGAYSFLVCEIDVINMSITKLEVESWRDAIIAMHDKILDESGGQKGVRDIGGLEHAIFSIMRINNKRERAVHVAAKVYHMLATRHYFFDGNKRTAHITAKVLLLFFGGKHLKIHYKEAVEFIVSIADKMKTLKEIQKWIEQNSENVSDAKYFIKELETELKQMKTE